MQNAEKAIVTLHLLTDKQIQNEVLYSTRTELLALSQFTSGVHIPLPTGISEVVGLFSVRILRQGQTLQNYQFQKLLTIGMHSIQLPTLTFKIQFQIPDEQQSVYATSLHFYGPNFQNLNLPFSNQPVFQTITKAVRDIEGSSFTSGRSMTFFSSQDRSQTIDLYATFLQNTAYVLRIPLYKNVLSDKINKNVEITNININGYMLCFIDTFLACQKKLDIKKTTQAAISAGISPEVFFDYQLKQDDNSKFKSCLASFLKAAGAKGKQIDELIQSCCNLSRTINQIITNMTITRQQYVIEPKQINSIKLSKSIVDSQIMKMTQELVNRIRDIENYVFIFPYKTQSRIYSLKYVNSKERQHTQFMLIDNVSLNASLYDIITAQPILIEASNIFEGKMQIANEEQKRFFDLNFVENVAGQIGCINNNQFSFLYYYPANKFMTKKPKEEEVVVKPPKVVKMATIEQIRKLTMLQQVVQSQQTEIEINQKKLDKYYHSKTNYQKLTKEEIEYLSKSIHMNEPSLVVTVNDATTDIMKTYSKRQLGKMLIQGLQQLNHDSMKIYDDVNKLRTEEKKLLEDQKAIIHYMTRTLQQFERKKQGISYASQFEGSQFENVSNIADNSHYVAYRPNDYVFDQSLQFRQDSQLQFQPQLPVFAEEQSVFSKNSLSIQTQNSIVNIEPQNQQIQNIQPQITQSQGISQHSKLLQVHTQLEQQKDQSIQYSQPASKSQIFEEKPPTASRIASSRPPQPKPVEQSTISQYRRPPQILPNVSSASMYLEMNMK